MDKDGNKRTGIFALVDDEVVFELDPLTKQYLFRGKVETSMNGRRIAMDPTTNSLKMYDLDGLETFSLSFTEDPATGFISPEFLIKGSNTEDFPYIKITRDRICSYEYVTSERAPMEWSISKDGIEYSKNDNYGFALKVDGDMTSGKYAFNVTRARFTYLLDYVHANDGDI